MLLRSSEKQLLLLLLLPSNALVSNKQAACGCKFGKKG